MFYILELNINNSLYINNVDDHNKIIDDENEKCDSGNGSSIHGQSVPDISILHLNVSNDCLNDEKNSNNELIKNEISKNDSKLTNNVHINSNNNTQIKLQSNNVSSNEQIPPYAGIYKKNLTKRSNHFLNNRYSNNNTNNNNQQFHNNGGNCLTKNGINHAIGGNSSAGMMTLPNNLSIATSAISTIRIPTADGNVMSLGCSTLQRIPNYGLPKNAMLNIVHNENNIDHSAPHHRYLTYGTTAQLQQDYDKFIPWPTLTEFRLRRKLRRLKRRARKLLNGNNLLGRSFNQLQNVRKLIKVTKLSKSERQKMLNHLNNVNNNGTINSNADDSLLNISRSSSLTSLLNLIEEANKNLLNSFEERDMKNNFGRSINGKCLTLGPPKCPPRLKRAMSSIIVSGSSNDANGIANNTEIAQQSNSNNYQKLFLKNSDQNRLLKHATLPESFGNDSLGINGGSNKWITNTKKIAAENYKIAFVENKQQQPQPHIKQTGSNDIDTISVKSLDSYFGPTSLVLANGNETNDNYNGNNNQKNSKILCVRSHFQINDGTIYLEDSDWEMCSEISEPLSLNNVENLEQYDQEQQQQLLQQHLTKLCLSEPKQSSSISGLSENSKKGIFYLIIKFNLICYIY